MAPASLPSCRLWSLPLRSPDLALSRGPLLPATLCLLLPAAAFKSSPRPHPDGVTAGKLRWPRPRGFAFPRPPVLAPRGSPGCPWCHHRGGWEGARGAAQHSYHPGTRLRGRSDSGSAGSCLQAGSGVLQDLTALGLGVPCLPQCLPVPTPGGQVSGLGRSWCWDVAGAGGMVSPQAMGHGWSQCHQKPWYHYSQ